MNIISLRKTRFRYATNGVGIRKKERTKERKKDRKERRKNYSFLGSPTNSQSNEKRKIVN